MPGGEKATSKNAQKIYRSINQKITEGFNGNFEELLSESFIENGFNVNAEKINELRNNLVKMQTGMKLDNIREYNAEVINNGINATPQTKNMLSVIYRKALEQCLNKYERIDVTYIREYLQEEMFKLNDDGTPRYSEVVRNNFENLVRFAEELNNNPEMSKIVNNTIVNTLEEESRKIGRGWIRKILSTNDLPRQLSYEEAVELDKRIYPEGSELEVDTTPVVALKNLSKEELNEAMQILENNGYSNILTFGKLEIMFGGLILPVSENFKKYFLQHKEEFISKPELFSKFTKIASSFDEIISNPILNTKFSAGILSTKDVLNAFESIEKIYEGQAPGEEELATTMKDLGLEPVYFPIAQEIYAQMLQREHQTVPPEQGRTSRFVGRIVRIDDPIHIAIGDGTDCCQTIGDAGETSMRHSALSNQGALFLVHELDEFGQAKRLIAQSWTWRNGNRVCFDNVEIPHDIIREFEKIGGFDGIMEAYEAAAEHMIETDRLALRQLVEKGRITEEQYRASVIKDVTMGLGCDDLVKNLSPEKRKLFEKVTPIFPEKEPSSHLYSDSKAGNILIRHNEEFDENDHSVNQSNVSNIGVKYTKIRDKITRRGKDVHRGLMKKAREILTREGKLEGSSFEGLEGDGIIDYANKENLLKDTPDGPEIDGIFEMAMSTSNDWFILSLENENEITICESILTQLPNPKTLRGKLDNLMAKQEYQRELLTLIAKAASKEKQIRINPEREGIYGEIQELIDNGTISVTDGVVHITDKEKFKAKVEELDKGLEDARRGRLLSDIPPEEKRSRNKIRRRRKIILRGN